MLRAAALLLIVAAFARPFFRRARSRRAAGGGAREVVILLDQSASMGYGDRWQRAQHAARDASSIRWPATIARRWCCSRATPKKRPRDERSRAGSNQAVDAAKVTSGATRYGPALKLAQSILGAIDAATAGGVLISDFQKTGWTGAEEVRLPEGTVLTPVSVAGATRRTSRSPPSRSPAPTSPARNG